MKQFFISSLTSSPFPLSLDAFRFIISCPTLECLDLSCCRTVVDANNNVAGLCSPSVHIRSLPLMTQDIFSISRESSNLVKLLLPDVCTVKIGTVAKCFPLPSVAVVSLTRTLRVGDIVQLHRVARDVRGSDPHLWCSVKVSNIPWYSSLATFLKALYCGS